MGLFREWLERKFYQINEMEKFPSHGWFPIDGSVKFEKREKNGLPYLRLFIDRVEDGNAIITKYQDEKNGEIKNLDTPKEYNVNYLSINYLNHFKTIFSIGAGTGSAKEQQFIFGVPFVGNKGYYVTGSDKVKFSPDKIKRLRERGSDDKLQKKFLSSINKEKFETGQDIRDYYNFLIDKGIIRKHRSKEEMESDDKKELLSFIDKNKKFVKQNIEDIENKTIEQLSQIKNEIKQDEEYKKVTNKEWRQREDNIVKGLRFLFDNKKLSYNGRIIDNSDGQFVVEGVGGPNQSDIKVTNTKGKKDSYFFVESKLDYKSAEYFKFGVTIQGNKISYDHKGFIDQKMSQQEKSQIDRIFAEMNLDKILTDTVLKQNDEFREGWEEFLKNWDNLISFIKDFISSDKNFDKYSFQQPNNLFPEQFKTVAKYYDDYFNFYAKIYDTLIDRIFEKIGSETIVVDDKKYHKKQFKILVEEQDRKDIDEDSVFQTIALLRTVVNGNQKLEKVVEHIEMIEGKFNAMIEYTGAKDYRGLRFNKRGQEKNKLRYFYKMFVSKTGRKEKGSYTFQKVENDTLGTMYLMPIVEFDSDLINQAITTYYLNKDRCAYIQVAKDIYLLRKTFDFFKLKDLKGYDIKLFNEIKNKLTCALMVSDNLDKISLHIKLQDIDEERSNLSFDIRDEEFIGKLFDVLKINTGSIDHKINLKKIK